MPTPGNSINEATTGVTGFTGTAFVGSPATQHCVQIGGSTTSTLSSVSNGTTGQILTAVTGLDPTFQDAAASSKVTTFLASSTWTIDPRSKSVEFYVWGSGAGGGSGRCGASGTAGGGAGGGPGQFCYVKTLPNNLTASPYTVTIGAGGTGGISVNAIATEGNPGNPGNPSSVSGVIIASGGGAGGGGSGIPVSGGAGVTPFLTTALITVLNETFNGGSGSNTSGGNAGNLTYGWATGGGGASGYTVATPRVGARGGNIIDQAGSTLLAGGLAGANTGATAGNGNAPTSQPLMLGGTGGGGGGNNGTSTAGTGGNGAQPGGGGGGGGGNLNSNPSGAGGNGGDGKIVIIEYF